MSTILRALRRFDEDGPSEASSSPSDPSVVDELRSRILAEEQAANGGDWNRKESARPAFAVVAAALVVGLALGLGVGLDSVAPISNSLGKPVGEGNAQGAEVPAASPDQDSIETAVASSRRVTTDVDRSAEGHGSARPLALVSPAANQGVAEHRSLHSVSELTILRTAWHPRPERRTATVRLRKTRETRTLREGDAIDGLVLKEISPSAVVFLSGLVEIRLRLGQAE